MKNKGIVLALSIFLVGIIVIFAVAITLTTKEASKGNKTIEVTIVYADKTEKNLTIKTNKGYLGEVLFDEKLTTEAEFKSGFYTFIDGVRADYNKDKAWWFVTQNGKEIMVGMNEVVITDGDKFEITHTPA